MPTPEAGGEAKHKRLHPFDFPTQCLNLFPFLGAERHLPMPTVAELRHHLHCHRHELRPPQNSLHFHLQQQ